MRRKVSDPRNFFVLLANSFFRLARSPAYRESGTQRVPRSRLTCARGRVLRLRRALAQVGKRDVVAGSGKVGWPGARSATRRAVGVPEGGSIRGVAAGSRGGGRGRGEECGGRTKGGRVAEGKGSGSQPVDSCFLVFYFMYIVFF